MARKVNLLLYCAFSGLSIAFGILSLFTPRGSTRTFEEHHLGRELGAMAIFVGLMAFWCIIHYQRRQLVHLFLMVFAALLSMIHWQDYVSGDVALASPLYNTLPLVVLLFMSLLSRATREHAAQTAA